MINDISRCFPYRNKYNQVLKHLLLIIDHSDYNGYEDITIFSNGDDFVDTYYFNLIYVKGIHPDWMGFKDI